MGFYLIISQSLVLSSKRMEALPSSAMLDNENQALKTLLDSFGSVFSLEDIASAFCKAGRDANRAGELLCGMSMSLSSDTSSESNGFVESEIPSTVYINDEFGKSCYANGNGDCKGLRSKKNPVSMGTVSSMLGKNYVWRPKKNATAETKPVEVETNNLSGSVYSPRVSLSTRDEDANQTRDFENFLFEMLGQGFQLERSAIRDVLGQCGYDMKKSLETLLDLAAVTLDGRNNCHEGSNLNSNSETLPSQYYMQTQKYAKSGSRTVRTDGISSKQPTERYEQQKEVLTALFHVPEIPDPSVGASVLKSVRRYGRFGTVVTEPLKDIEEDRKAEATSHNLVNVKDEAEEDEYQILRKAVREYRDTMKEYYKAAAEAFASGDRTRAGILLEKGQFFYNKAREADEESAQRIFETSSGGDVEMQDEISLDLQNHDAKEAIRLLKSHLRSLGGIGTFKNLKIIVGMGEQNVEKRKRLVKKLLDRAAIKWTEDQNLGTILIRLDEINPRHLSFPKNS